MFASTDIGDEHCKFAEHCVSAGSNWGSSCAYRKSTSVLRNREHILKQYNWVIQALNHQTDHTSLNEMIRLPYTGFLYPVGAYHEIHAYQSIILINFSGR